MCLVAVGWFEVDVGVQSGVVWCVQRCCAKSMALNSGLVGACWCLEVDAVRRVAGVCVHER